MNERQIFEAALDITDSARREAYLSQVCGADAALRARVDALLAAHSAASQFLETPAVEQMNATPDTSGDATLQLPPSHAALPGEIAAEMDSDGEIPHGPDLSFLSPSTKTGSIGTLGHYEIIKVLGQGAFGIVFKAFDEKLHRHVAIKTMSVPMAATSPARKRFLREARAAAAIRHENVVQVYSVEEQPIPYLVMEYIDGETLQQKQRSQGPLEVPETLHLARQIASGLAAAHSQSLIHRDVKPGNILLERGAEQKVKITDFGLARAADDASLTRSGMISGTPLYMSPEQAFGQSLDHRSDLFSLGSVMYELITGRPPFRAPNTVAVLKRVVDDTPRPIHELIPETPDWLIAIVNQLLAKKPDERFQSAKEVADLLARCQSELQLTGQVTCVPPQPASPARAAGSASARSTPDDSDPTAVHPPLMSLAGKEVRSIKSLFWIVFVMMFTGGMTTAVINTQTTQINKLLAALLVIGAVALLGRVLSIRKRSQSPKASMSQTPSNDPQRDLFWWWAGIAGIAGVTSIALPMIFFDTWPVGFQALPGLIVVMVIATSLLLNNVRRARAFGQRVAAQDPPVTDFSGVWAAHVAEYNKRTPQEHEQDRRRRHWTALMLGGLLMLVSASPFLAAKLGRYFNSWIWPAIPTLPQTALTAGLNFDGKDDHVEFAPVDWSYPQFTIEAFVISTLRSDNGITVSLTSGGKPWEIMELYDGSHNGSGQRQSGAQIMGKTPIATAYGPLTPGVRQHRALVFDGSHMHYYINGIWQGKRRAEAYEGEKWKRWNLKQLRLGCDGDGKKRFEGQIDQVRISKVARYNDNFAPVTSVESDDQTLALYDFAQGSGDVLKDISGNGHDGKIVGATWVKPEVKQPNHPQVITVEPKALQFNGKNYAKLPVELFDSGEWTMDFVISGLDQSKNDMESIAVVDKGEGEQRIRRHLLIDRRENPSIHLFYQNGVKSRFRVASLPPGGRRHRLTFAWPAGEPVLYIDGMKADLIEATWVHPPNTQEDYFHLGSGSTTGTSGVLHEFKLSRGTHVPNTVGVPAEFTPDLDTVLLYHCDERTGSILRDASGRENNATLVDPLWISEKSVPAAEKRPSLRFDGVDDYVHVPTLRFPGAPFTMEAWLLCQGDVAKVSGKEPLQTAFGWEEKLAWNAIRQEARKSQGMLLAWNIEPKYVVSPHTGPMQTDWLTHVAIVVTETEIRCYRNGKMNMTQKLEGPLASKIPWRREDHFAIGATLRAAVRGQDRYGQLAQFFQGEFHALRLSKSTRYDEGFVPNELTSDGETIALYDFAQGSGDVLKDISGNGHDGKIVGATWVKPTPADSAEVPLKPGLKFATPESHVAVDTLAFQPEEPLTLEAWVTAEEFQPTGYLSLVAGMGPLDLKLNPSAKVWEFLLWNQSVKKPLSDSMLMAHCQPGRLTHLCGIWDPKSGLSFYVDGKKVGTSKTALTGNALLQFAQSSADSALNPSLVIGGLRPVSESTRGNQLIGIIHEMRVSRVVRYQDDFVPTQNWRSDSSTIALYDFAQGSGDVLKDISGNGHDGKIVGATWVDRNRSRQTSAAPSENGKSLTTSATGQPTGWQGWPADAPAPAIAPFNAEQAQQHQAEWAKYLQIEVEYTNTLGMKFVLIPPGEFTMGSTAEEIAAALNDIGEDKHWQECIQSEAPQHKVILTQPIYLGVNEVTQAEYEKVMGVNPSHFAPLGMGKEAVAGLETTEHPVEEVSWNDAAEFCEKLSNEEQLKPFYFRAGETITPLNGTGYRLPSEAEWEFACRSGTITKFWVGDKDEDLLRAGWIGRNSGGSRTHAVGELKANQFGMFDTHGNVWEWVQDGWDATSYGQFQKNPAINPSSPYSRGSGRLIRGGVWYSHASYCRSSGRLALAPTARKNHFGFRVSLTIDAVKAAKAKLKSKPVSITGWHGWPAEAPAPAIAPFDAEQAQQHQAAWAKYLNVPIEHTNSLGMQFRLIPPGEFTMGSTPAEIEAAAQVLDDPQWLETLNSEAPQHKVILTQPFYLGMHEVTQGQYAPVMGQNPAFFSATGTGKEAVVGIDTTRFPVEMVSWDEVTEYCEKLSQSEQLKSATTKGDNGYRLPTEAEWEWACRAGTLSQFSAGEGEADLQKAAWFEANAEKFVHPVGERAASPFGLHDTHGNVWEWVQDGWEPSAYAQSGDQPAIDPQTRTAVENKRMYRGGSWFTNASSCRSGSHRAGPSTYQSYFVGFRVALPVDAVRKALKLKAQGSPQPVASNPDRALAEWVISQGGTVQLDGQTGTIDKVEKLPSTLFQVQEIKLEAQDCLTDDDFERLRGLQKLTTIYVIGSQSGVTDRGFERLADAIPSSLTTLIFYGNLPNVTDAAVTDLNRLANLKTLGLHASQLTNDGMAGLSLPLLADLGITNGKATLLGLKDAKKRLPSLYVMQVEGVQIPAEEYPILSQWNLGIINLVNVGIRDQDLPSLHSHLELTTLSLRGNPAVTDAGVPHLLAFGKLNYLVMDYTEVSNEGFAQLQKLPELNLLYASHLKLTDAGFASISQFPKLQVLRINETEGITDATLEQLAKCKTLQSLSIQGCPQLTEAGVRQLQLALPNCQIMSDFPNVASLPAPSSDAIDYAAERQVAEWAIGAKARFNVESAGQVIDITDVSQLPSGQFHIHALAITPQTTFGPSDFSQIGRLRGMIWLAFEEPLTEGSCLVEVGKVKSLEGLKLQGAQVTDAHLSALTGLTNLTELDLNFSPIDDAGMGAVVQLTSLKKLSLGESRVGDEGLAQLKKLSQLESLHLGATVTDQGLGHLANLPKLHAVHGLKSHHLKEVGIGHLQQMPNVTTLNVVAATDEDLVRLKPLAHLTSLVFNYHQFSPSGLETLGEFPKLDSLSLGDLPSVDDSYWPPLVKLNTLRYLLLTDVKVTAEGIAVFREQRPEVLLHVNGANYPATSTVSDFMAAPWSAPVNLGPNVNTPDREASPTLTDDEMLIVFTRAGEFYESRRVSKSEPFGLATKLTGPFTGPAKGLPNASLSGDGLLLAYSSGINGEENDDVLLASRPDRDSPFGEPVRLPEPINTSGFERHPILSSDGLMLALTTRRAGMPAGTTLHFQRADRETPFAGPPMVSPDLQGEWSVVEHFTSDGLGVFKNTMADGNEVITWHSRPDRLSLFGKGVPLPATLNEMQIGSPRLSADGQTLYFHSRRPGGVGELDLWMSRRTPKTP